MSFKIQVFIEGLKRDKWVGIDGLVGSQKEAQVFDSRTTAEIVIDSYVKNYRMHSRQFIIKDKDQARSKYNNQPCWIFVNSDKIIDAVAGQKPENAEYFPSRLEAKTYLILKKVFGIKNFTSQFAVEVKPKTPIYPAIYWKVDFKVHEPFVLIEAKGENLPEFKRNLQYLQLFNPVEFGQLIVVKTEREKIDSAIYSMGLKEFEEHLMRIKQK
jgi:hypothetical protein